MHLFGRARLRAQFEQQLHDRGNPHELVSAAQADWIIDFGETLEEKQVLFDLRARAPMLSLTYPASPTHLAARTCYPDRVVGFSALPPVSRASVLELMPALQSSPALVAQARELLESTGLRVIEVGETPAGVAARTVACLVNEAVSAVAERVADPATIDTAMRLGTNYPRGPLEWAGHVGLRAVLAMLEGLYQEYGEDRYRPHPLLRRAVLAGRETL
nr:3-hydroxyacyl-CoA dehydrogenase family protein [Deinobacterium chartae]